MSSNTWSVKAWHASTWQRVYACAMFTDKGVYDATKEPSKKWIRRILRSEHSPIRAKEYVIECHGIDFTAVYHIVRHFIGDLHYVHSSRPDRNSNVPTDRHEHRKDDPTDYLFIINAQALINISKVRLCHKAEKVTREFWEMVKNAIAEIDPEMASFMVPTCIYRGICCEMKPCGDMFEIRKEYCEKPIK